MISITVETARGFWVQNGQESHGKKRRILRSHHNWVTEQKVHQLWLPGMHYGNLKAQFVFLAFPVLLRQVSLPFLFASADWLANPEAS